MPDGFQLLASWRESAMSLLPNRQDSRIRNVAAFRGAVHTTPKAFLSALLSLACVFTLGVDLPAAAAANSADKTKKIKLDPALKGLPITELTADEAVRHALNRLAYGPRPGDVERVKQMGLAKWIDQQLNPNSIDDHALQARLENYPTLAMSTTRLIEDYPQPKQAAKEAAKVQAQAVPQTRADAAAAAVAKDTPDDPNKPVYISQDFPNKSASSGNNSSGASAGSGSAATVLLSDGSTVPAAQMSAPISAPIDAQTSSSAPSPMKEDPAAENVATRSGGAKRDVLGGADPNAVPKAIADDSKRPARVIEELAMAKVTRAIYSDRQLQQVLDDFWFNHFNVFAGKGEDRYYLTSYERDVIQPRTLGKFKDLVTATAESPAMLFYLDNFLSADPRAAARQAAERAARQQTRFGYRRPFPPPQNPQPQKKKQERGLNENYGRELMELHTLGVDGGYTQKDVTEVARCFTGWSIEKPRENPVFKFDEKLHDPDPKIVLGKKIRAGGMKDGEQVIDLLTHHPSTAKFISTELARRFVSDTPPPALVARMAQTFLAEDGDIHAVMHTMIYSPEFWSRDAFRAKIKTPYELVISAVRALGTDVDTPMPLVQWVNRIGQPLYQCQPPTGYSDKAEAWVNTGALLNRLNFSLTLAGNKVRGSRTDVTSLLGMDAGAEPKVALTRAVDVFLGGAAAPTTVETLEKQLDNPQVIQAKLDDPTKQTDLGVVTGLVLGAPEFQRR
jgi:uncharacterized protein (DUF1800 family)